MAVSFHKVTGLFWKIGDRWGGGEGLAKDRHFLRSYWVYQIQKSRGGMGTVRKGGTKKIGSQEKISRGQCPQDGDSS